MNWGWNLFIDWWASPHKQSLNTLDNEENQNFVGNEGSTKPTGAGLRNLEQGYMKEQKEVEKNQPV